MSSSAGNPFVERVRRYTWNREHGGTREIEFVGNFDAIPGQASIFQEFFESYEMVRRGAQWICTATIADNQNGSDAPIDEIRMSIHRANVSMYEHPNFANVSKADLRKIRKNINNNEDDDITGQLGGGGADVLYNLLLEGVTHFIVEQPVIQRVWTASNRYQFNLNYYAKLNRIFLSSAMLAELNMPGNILGFPLDQTLNGDGIKEYGWLKHGPEYQKSADNRAVMTQEYEYGLWHLDAYRMSFE